MISENVLYRLCLSKLNWTLFVLDYALALLSLTTYTIISISFIFLIYKHALFMHSCYSLLSPKDRTNHIPRNLLNFVTRGNFVKA